MIEKVGRRRITVRRFPLQKVTEFELPAAQFADHQDRHR